MVTALPWFVCFCLFQNFYHLLPIEIASVHTNILLWSAQQKHTGLQAEARRLQILYKTSKDVLSQQNSSLSGY